MQLVTARRLWVTSVPQVGMEGNATAQLAW